MKVRIELTGPAACGKTDTAIRLADLLRNSPHKQEVDIVTRQREDQPWLLEYSLDENKKEFLG